MRLIARPVLRFIILAIVALAVLVLLCIEGVLV